MEVGGRRGGSGVKDQPELHGGPGRRREMGYFLKTVLKYVVFSLFALSKAANGQRQQ